MVKSIGFVQFMASEDSETLILAFTSKTGHSVPLAYLKGAQVVPIHKKNDPWARKTIAR